MFRIYWNKIISLLKDSQLTVNILSVVKDKGLAIGVRHANCANPVFGVMMTKELRWSTNYDEPFNTAFGPINKISDGNIESVLFEFNGIRGLPVGIVLNDMGKAHDSMSITAENGSLVVRNETTGGVLGCLVVEPVSVNMV